MLNLREEMQEAADRQCTLFSYILVTREPIWLPCHLEKPLILLVGARGFEPPASWSRTKRATKLRYAPLLIDYNTALLLEQ